MGNLFTKKNKKIVKITYDGGSYYLGEVLDDQPHGKGIIFTENGKKLKEGTFKNGKLHGKNCIDYWFNTGNIAVKGSFENDKPHGIITEYTISGNIISKYEYRYGIKWREISIIQKITNDENENLPSAPPKYEDLPSAPPKYELN